MSHNSSGGHVPYISSHTSTVSVAGVQNILITGFGLSPATSVVIDSNLGTLVSRSFAKASATSGTITLSVNAAAPPAGSPADRTLTVSHGGYPVQGTGVTGSGVLTVQHGFSPTDVSGMTLWLDGADESTFTKSANRVSKWEDKSGNRDFEQATGSEQPTYVPNTAGGGTGAFSGKGGALSIGEVAGTPTYLAAGGNVIFGGSGHVCTMFYVLSKRAVGGNSGWGDFVVIGPGSGHQLILRYHDGSSWLNNRWGVSGQSRLEGTSTVDLGSKYLVTVTHKGTGVNDTLRVNGVEEDAVDMNFSIGSGHSSWNYHIGYSFAANVAEVEIAEILYYDSVLSNTDRDGVEAYLTGKWGV